MAQPLTLSPPYPHIDLDKSGNPRIEGTTMKVVELVVAHQAYGWSPEELHFQFPHLSLGQIHSALAYYWDHQEALDQDIAQRLARTDTIRRAQGPSPLAARLRSQGPP